MLEKLRIHVIRAGRWDKFERSICEDVVFDRCVYCFNRADCLFKETMDGCCGECFVIDGVDDM